MAALTLARPGRRRLDLSGSELGWPLLLAVCTQFDVWPPGPLNLGHVVGPRPLLSLLYIVTSLALVWRRRAPLVVLAFVASADAFYFLSFGAPEGLGSVLPMLFALYAVGRYCRPANLYVAAPLVLLGTAVHELSDPIFQLSGLEVILWAVIATAWPVGYALQRRADEAERLTSRAQQLAADREAAALQAVDAERARIARELHDIVGHGISVAVLQMVAAAGFVDKGQVDPAKERLLSAERSARDALAEMRRLLGLLDRDGAVPPGPQPGMKQLDRLVDDIRSAGATITVRIHGKPTELTPGLDLAAFRILQESLTNVLKHAQPPCADVLVAYQQDHLALEVHNDGTRACEPGTDGRGVTGMRERATLYGGEFSAGPGLDGGYTARAWLPIGGS